MESKEEKGGETVKAPSSVPVVQSECLEMTQLRNYLDMTVDVLVSKLEKNQFLEAIPAGVDKQFATSLHNRFCSVMRTKMCKIVEERLNEYSLGEKLNELNEITKNTPYPVSHKAWRPPRNETVESCVQAHDFKVLNEHKAKLTELLESVKSENEDLLKELQEVQRRMQENQAVLTNMNTGYENIIHAFDQVIPTENSK
eukprot:TRINITY_DN5028_c0_g1_i6.p1 TRINITY_DN5028_c0_g1~~TRINITY_DN5028_c0_g1_i6.p1  ORF type:complete len:199 (-),score=37.22 TRINITY_DN5028_c0_g1_i6:173-769(-)